MSFQMMGILVVVSLCIGLCAGLWGGASDRAEGGTVEIWHAGDGTGAELDELDAPREGGAEQDRSPATHPGSEAEGRSKRVPGLAPTERLASLPASHAHESGPCG